MNPTTVSIIDENTGATLVALYGARLPQDTVQAYKQWLLQNDYTVPKHKFTFSSSNLVEKTTLINLSLQNNKTAEEFIKFLHDTMSANGYDQATTRLRFTTSGYDSYNSPDAELELLSMETDEARGARLQDFEKKFMEAVEKFNIDAERDAQVNGIKKQIANLEKRLEALK